MAYAYDLLGVDARKEFKDFNIEQQADIICHYYLAVYHKNYSVNQTQFPTLLAQQTRREYILRRFLKNPMDKNLKSIEWNWGRNDQNKSILGRAVNQKFYRRGTKFYSF